MRHYYVINGNEFGVDLFSKNNFKDTEIDECQKYFDKVKNEDTYCCMVYVDNDGKETILKQYNN